nr:6-bladed beta-propeller [Bacteroidota bacterium]
MKTHSIYLTIVLFLIFNVSHAQQIDYNAPAVQLIPDASFLPDADWEKLFYDDTQTNSADRIGINKQFTIGAEEKIYISDRYNFTISILSKSGRLIKTFGKKGRKPGEFANNQNLDGIFNDRLLVISDNQGRINFFDLDGNFIKIIIIDFMPLRILPGKSDKLFIWGHVPMKDRSKHVIAELDYTTEKYKVIYETIPSETQTGRIVIPSETGTRAVGAPYSAGGTFFRITDDNILIFAENNSNTVKLFSKSNGRYRESQFQIKSEPIKINPKEKEEYYQKFKQQLIKNGIDTIYAEKIHENGFFPEYLPNYYNLIVDNKNNCMFFIYTNDNEDYPFQAYSLDGSFLGKSELMVDGYELLSKNARFIFNDDMVYTLALKH